MAAPSPPVPATLCRTCGAPLGETCVRCHSMGEEAAARLLIGERRIATVVFADISGFTALSERIDPEEVRGLMNDCFDLLVPIVEEFGGVVDKFLGDGVMALFGAPIAHEDDPVRALGATLEMLRTMRRVKVRGEHRLDLHAGLNTGLLVSGGIGSKGRQQYSVMGDTVNLAARLEDASQAGEILVGPETRRLAGGAFEFGPPRELRVKGKVLPVEVHPLLGPARATRTLRPTGTARVPLVGRKRELLAVRGLEAAITDQAGGVVLLLGEPGLGKSRLLTEWKGASGGSRWLGAHCVSYGSGLAYHFLVSLLQAIVATPTTDPGDVERALRRFLDGIEGGEADFPFLAHLGGLPLSPENATEIDRFDAEGLQVRYVEALSRGLLALVSRSPVVLVCEDMQWIDPSSAALLSRLLPLADRAPILFVFSARPTEDSPGSRLLAEARSRPRGRFLEVPLLPLSEASSRELLSCLAGNAALADPVRRQILLRSEGNPLFVEEMMRMLADRAPAPGDAVDVPENIQSLLLARIDRLDPDARHVLRVAAVLGRELSRAVLEAMLTDPLREPVGTYVEMLSAGGLLESVAGGASVRFRHALVQETAYGSLLREERARLHLAAGLALERLPQEEAAQRDAQLARHFLEGGDRLRAIRHLLAAGSRDLSAFANPEAEARFRELLRQNPEPPVRTEAATNLGEALFRQGRYDEALACWREAIALAGTLGAVDRQIELHARAGRLAWWGGRAAEGLTLCLEGLALAKDAAPTPALAALLMETGRAHFFTGNLAAAEEPSRRALAIGRELRLVDVEVESLTTLGLVLRSRREIAAAEALLREAAELADRTDRVSAALLLAAARAHNNVGTLLEQDLGDLRPALEAYGRSLERVRLRRSPNEELFVAAQAALLLFAVGEWDELRSRLPDLRRLATETAEGGFGRVLLEQAEAQLDLLDGSVDGAVPRLRAVRDRIRELGDSEALYRIDLSLAELLPGIGCLADSVSAAREAVAIAERGLADVAVPLALLSRALVAAGESAEAAATYARAEGVVAADPPPAIRAALLRAKAAVFPEAASEALREAESIYDRIALPFLRGETLRERAAAEARAGRPAEARDLLREAEVVRRDLGLGKR